MHTLDDVGVVGKGDDGAAAAGQLVHGGVDVGASLRVQALCRLVEHGERPIGGERPGQGQAPADAERQVVAVVGYHGVEALGVLAHKGTQAGAVDELVEAAFVELRIEGEDVVAQAGVEEARLLGQVGHLPPPPRGNQLGEVDAVDQDMAAARFDQPHHQPCQGRLARAVGPGDNEHRPRIELERQGFEKRRPTAGIAKSDVLELDGALVVFEGRALLAFEGQPGKLLEHVEGLAGLGEGLAERPQLGDGPERPRRQNVAADERADVELAAHHEDGAHGDHGDAHQRLGALSEGLDQAVTRRDA